MKTVQVNLIMYVFVERKDFLEPSRVSNAFILLGYSGEF
jgi:hypothetical protein